jgi:D-beta-D-heptose 7-phosphate kinase/D-beta-D-heptose 1-phosphate adenosyltransferase
MFNLQNKKIAVVGDAIIDDYHFVNAEKISPEFPIPILNCENYFPDKRLLGGATNVCYQFLNFNKEIFYFGFLDLEIYDLLSEFSFINTEFSVLLPYFSKVPRKKRFYQNDFPLCRIDVESKNYNLTKSQLNFFQNKISKNLEVYKFDAVIFSDYNKGIFNDFEIKKMFDSLQNAFKIVDPKKGPISKWRGCDLIKPNYKEAFELTGKEHWKDQIEVIKKDTDCEIIVITIEGKGVVGCVENNYFEFFPKSSTKAVSVIGAGDCFISLLCSGLLSDFSINKSIEIAFDGASIYVKNKFNKPIEPNNLFNKVIFTSGVFDLLHSGHLESLSKSKELGNKLIVGINSDESTRKLKGKDRPVNNQDIRKKMLESLRFVDEVIIFEEDTPYELINKIKPDIIVKGSDYSVNDVVGKDLAEVVIIPNEPGYSTSSIISKIKNEDKA